jgi:hypothetical protein
MIEGCKRMNMVEILCIMNENGKLKPVENIAGMGGGRVKEWDGRGEFKYDIL